MKISLRSGEKIYMNGAVFSVDRRVSLQLLNDVTFLLEAHVMQPEDATTPLRQVYFALQTMLMDPPAAAAIGLEVRRTIDVILACEKAAERRAVLHNVAALLTSGRHFEALRDIRGLYRSEDNVSAKLEIEPNRGISCR